MDDLLRKYLKTNYKHNQECFIANMLFAPQIRVRIAARIGIGVIFGSSLEYKMYVLRCAQNGDQHKILSNSCKNEENYY
jgi:hypothetical protein